MADKYLNVISGVMTQVEAKASSAGAGDAGKIPALDSSGRLDSSMMPVGIAADTASILASENLAAGDLVNVYNNSGTANIRKADASTTGKFAHGFVLAAVTSGNNGTVYFEGTNTQVTSLTPGRQYLSTTPGLATSTAPSSSGNVVQVVGVANAAAALNFEAGEPVVLA
jgi:hypothetical protein